MPSSAEAAIVFLALFVPGYLYLAGYRLGRAVTEQRDGINTVAKVIAASTLLVVVTWRLGGHELHDHVRAGTALTTHQEATWRFALAALLLPGALGFLAGEAVDAAARRVGDLQRRLASPQPPRCWRRLARRFVDVLAERLLHDGPTPWDSAWREVTRTAPRCLVHVTTKNGREILGLVAERSRVGVAPQPRDLYLEAVVRRSPDGRLHELPGSLGAFVAGSEVECVEWLADVDLYDG